MFDRKPAGAGFALPGMDKIKDTLNWILAIDATLCEMAQNHLDSLTK